MRAAVEGGPAAGGKGLGWQGFAVERFAVDELRLSSVRSVDYVVLLQLEGISHQAWSYGGFVNQREIQPGQVSMIPAELPFSCDVRRAGVFLAVSITRAFLCSASIAAGIAASCLPLQPFHGEDCPLVRELIAALARVAFGGLEEERAYGESLAYRLALHLSLKHPRLVQSISRPSVRGIEGLDPDQLAAVLVHLNEHFVAGARLKDLAQLAGVSRFHFVRQFKRSTGLTPHQYLTRLRIEEARRRLSLPRADVTDVALSVGFCNANHLARHFRAAYGITPARFLRLCPREQAPLTLAAEWDPPDASREAGRVLVGA